MGGWRSTARSGRNSLSAGENSSLTPHPHPARHPHPPTVMSLLRIERLGFGKGRQRMALERRTLPTLSYRTCIPGYGLQSCWRDQTGVVKRRRELLAHPIPLLVRFTPTKSLHLTLLSLLISPIYALPGALPHFLGPGSARVCSRLVTAHGVGTRAACSVARTPPRAYTSSPYATPTATPPPPQTRGWWPPPRVLGAHATWHWSASFCL